MPTEITGTATLINPDLGVRGDARLYRVEPPITLTNWDDTTETFDYVVVSAVVADLCGPETYLFGANKDGEVLSWAELDGSYRGGLDHERALRQAGYSV